MRLACLLEWFMKQMMKRQTKFTKPWMQKWMREEKRAGMCIGPFGWLSLTLYQREAREAELLATSRAERPKIQAQFADLKRGLSAVSDTEWENLPEVGNLTGKRRKLNPREGRTYVVPDSILVGDRDRAGYENSLDPRQQMVGALSSI
jgi:hypothetical protein